MSDGKCDICKEREASTDVLDHLATMEVKRVCWECAEILDKYCGRIHNYGERQIRKARKELLRISLKAKAEGSASRIFWFLSNFRGILKQQLIREGTKFTTLKKEAPCLGPDSEKRVLPS